MKIDRMFGILMALHARERVTARELAERFEVSRRTIHRDVDALSRAGIPLYCKQGGEGGIFVAEGFRIDTRLLTREDLAFLLAGVQGVASVADADASQRLLRKLLPASALPVAEGMYIDLSSYHRHSLTDKIATLRAAMRERHAVAFCYYSERGAHERRVEPYVVMFKWESWYLYAYCLDRQGFRMFKLQRLWALRALPEAFEPRELPPDALAEAGSFADECDMELRVDPAVAYLVVEAYGPGPYERDEHGWWIVRVGYSNFDYMLRWVLGFGRHARVVSPPEMRDAVRAHARGMLGE